VSTTTKCLPRTREELLELCTQYFGEERVQAIRDGLTMTRYGEFRTPGKILMMLFPSRSGSNYFGQLLSSTGWFKEIAESFNHLQLAKIRERKGLADTHEAVQWMIDNRGTPHAFGFKAGFFVLSGAVETGFLSEVIDRTHVVLLRRRDRVAQAISLEKMKLSGRRHSRQPLERPLSDADYDGDKIRRQVININRTEEKLADCAERLGKSAPVYYYEDVCANPEKSVTSVCEAMGLKMPEDYQPAKVRLTVLRDELSERWADRFRNEFPDIN
jgi:LPS sulfotransferase NodH